MILYQKPYLTIEHDENLSCLIQRWKGFATSEQFREGIRQSVSYFEEKKMNKLISDTKDFAVVKKDDTDWVASHATPIMVRNGLKYMAFILPTNVFTQVSVNNFKSKADDILQIQYFDNYDKAIQWLVSLQ
jgi:hypothetical protein